MGTRKAVTVLVQDLEAFPEGQRQDIIDRCKQMGLDAEVEWFDERGVPVVWDEDFPWEDIEGGEGE